MKHGKRRSVEDRIFPLFSEGSCLPAGVRTFLLFLLVLVLLPLPYRNALAVTCHCFQDREYVPSQPATADPYVLATTRNSLLAAAAGMDKGSVVRLRMTGSTETDLWLGAYLPGRLGIGREKAEEARRRSASWSQAYRSLGLKLEGMGSRFLQAQASGDDDGMARVLAEEVLARSFDAATPTLDRLREAGAGIAEATLSLLLAQRLDRTPEVVFEEITRGQQTWGSRIHTLGVPLESVGDLVAEAVRKRNRSPD